MNSIILTLLKLYKTGNDVSHEVIMGDDDIIREVKKINDKFVNIISYNIKN